MRSARYLTIAMLLVCGCERAHPTDVDGAIACSLPDASFGTGPGCPAYAEERCEALRSTLVADRTVYLRCAPRPRFPMDDESAVCVSATSCDLTGQCRCGGWPECAAGSLCLDVDGEPRCVACSP